MSCVSVPKILMPKTGTDLYKWAVVACDQYTSQPEYWEETDRIVGDAPSTLRITLPEVFLENSDVEQLTDTINETMKQYLSDGTLAELPAGFILTERFSGGETPRRGLVAAIDLECYEYTAGSRSLVRPTEKTVVERIPPRLKIRKHASIEVPHIMLLIDDPDRTVIEPMFTQTAQLEQVYNTDLMQGGGHINGWFIPQGEQTDRLIAAMDALNDREVFQKKYHLSEELPLLPFAVGDGNHSMATAKAYWEEIKQTLTPEQQQDHPARFALCEIVNIHDESLIIEPIHRVMFQVDAAALLEAAREYYAANGSTCEITYAEDAASIALTQQENAHTVGFCFGDRCGTLTVHNPKWGIPLGTLQAFLDDYLSGHADAKIDYIHGTDVVYSLGTAEGNMGFLLPDIQKNDLFRGVIIDGVLPRKTFSMGEAHEKRYYMESKRIVK
ncbi:MAG TPA: DUF1015 domain-containing protein [Clostridiales bacterium]|nr:DUF1015 domain-containing protein [Clostridiales bacterium]